MLIDKMRRDTSNWVMCLFVSLEPRFPANGASRLLGAGIATLTYAARGFARQEDWEHSPVDVTLLEPHLCQFS